MVMDSGLHGSGMMSSAREAALLLDQAAADVGEQHAVAVLVEAEIAAGILHRLEGDAAHAGPGEGVADDLADLAVIDALLEHGDQGGGDVVALEVLQRLLAHAAQVGAADLHQRRRAAGNRTADRPRSRA